MKRLLAYVAFLALALGSNAASDTAGPAPRVDHHQHLLSPAAVALQNRFLEPVAVSPELADVIAAREKSWNDKVALAKLYTDDAVISAETRGWIHGAERSAAFMSMRFRAPYRLIATAVRAKGDAARIEGYYARGEGASRRVLGFFQLSLEKRDGRWAIAAETALFADVKPSTVQTAADLVRYLDEAGIARAVVLSDGYYFDSPKNDVTERLAKVRAENDWTAGQVAQFPRRLVAFCSFNPLAEHALAELERCHQSGRFSGVKLHFGTSGVDLNNQEHVQKVRAVVTAANGKRWPLIVHVRADAAYGAREARVLIEQVIAAAPDVTFQIAHLWGGEGFSDSALEVYANAVAAGDPRTRRLYFDLAEVGLVAGSSPEALQKVAERMRQIGLPRILYGSDGPVAESQSPAESWKTTHKLPLTDAEFAQIAANVAPYLADR